MCFKKTSLTSHSRVFPSVVLCRFQKYGDFPFWNLLALFPIPFLSRSSFLCLFWAWAASVNFSPSTCSSGGASFWGEHWAVSFEHLWSSAPPTPQKLPADSLHSCATVVLDLYHHPVLWSWLQLSVTHIRWYILERKCLFVFIIIVNSGFTCQSLELLIESLFQMPCCFPLILLTDVHFMQVLSLPVVFLYQVIFSGSQK